jgi:hypothetical protein
LKRVITLVIGLIFATNIQAQAPVTEKPLTEMFGTGSLKAPWSEDAKLLGDDNAVEKEGNAVAISATLKKIAGSKEADLWGLVPGILNVVARAPQAKTKIEALDTLQAVFLGKRVADGRTDRIAKEIAKSVKAEKDPGVKNAKLKTIAYAADPSTVQTFVEALEAGAKDPTFLAYVREYLTRVKATSTTIPVPGFQKLEKLLAAIGAANELALTQELLQRDSGTRKAKVEDLNNLKSVPTFPKGPHKAKK